MDRWNPGVRTLDLTQRPRKYNSKIVSGYSFAGIVNRVNKKINNQCKGLIQLFHY